jgi:hypothetical protein
MKKKNNSLLILLGIVALVLIASNFNLKDTFTIGVSPAKCNPSSCPSGYTDMGSYCRWTTGLKFECERECYRAAGCDSFGSSWSYASSKICLSMNSEKTCSTTTQLTNSNLCYRWKTQSYISFNTGSGKAVKSIASTTSNLKTSSCSSSSPVYSESNPTSATRGSSNLLARADAAYLNCGSSFVSSASGATVYLYYQTTPYYTSDWSYKTCTGSVQCKAASDCGSNGYIGSQFCSGGNVAQTYRTYSCSNYACSSNEETRIIQNCQQQGCSNGQCLQVECTTGQEKCEADVHFMCENSKWVSKGVVVGKCGIGCTERDIVIVDNDYQICMDGVYRPLWDVIELDYEQLQELTRLINELELSIEEKARIISELELTLSQQISLIDGLEASIEEKATIISSLELTLSEQVAMVSQLEAKIQQKIILINQLNLNIEQQAQIISELELTVEQQASVIEQLNLNIAEQAALINELTTNLAQKAGLVELLQVENEKQAELIAEMKLSFSEQAQIINALENTIADDAEIIKNLGLSLQQQGILINELRLTNQEQAQLINSLELTIEEQAQLITLLRKTIEDDAEIISNLRLSMDEQAQLVAALKLSLEQEVIIISNLKLSLEQERQLVAKLRETIEEQERLLDEISKIAPRREQNFIWVIWILVGALVLVFLLGGKRKR